MAQESKWRGRQRAARGGGGGSRCNIFTAGAACLLVLMASPLVLFYLMNRSGAGEAPSTRDPFLHRLRTVGDSLVDRKNVVKDKLELHDRRRQPPPATPAAPTTLTELQLRMRYWQLDALVDTGLYRQPLSDKYVLFLTDCGGFNNIRMVYEYAIIMAWITRRTLVLPPPSGWYLIDNGPMVRMATGKDKGSRVTDYSEFFDMEHLRACPVIHCRTPTIWIFSYGISLLLFP